MNSATIQLKRVKPANAGTNPVEGRVIWSPVKSLWFTSHLVAALTFGWATISPGAVAVSFGFTVFTLCLGHTIGLHRLLIHRSFQCPRWLEYFLVHLGTVVGMGGPFKMIEQHDLRDWAQRHPQSHPFYIDARPVWRDALWQLHCALRLKHPPALTIEPEVAGDPVYRWIQRTWMLQQLPWAILLWLCGGAGWVVWGISVRVVVSLTGHWLIGYLAHNGKERRWHINGHAVQGYNLRHLGLLTMGEGWHNNHHAFPESAKLGMEPGQHDPGWWALRLLARCGLVKDPVLPEALPPRPERVTLPVPPHGGRECRPGFEERALDALHGPAPVRAHGK